MPATRPAAARRPQTLARLREFADHGLNRPPEPRQLGLDLVFGYPLPLRLRLGPGVHERRPNDYPF